MKKSLFGLLCLIALVAIACGSTEKENVRKKAELGVKETIKQEVSDGIVTYTMKDAIMQKGEQTCLPVLVKNFNEIVSMQYTMKWNPAILKFVAVKVDDLKNMDVQNNFGISRANTGVLTTSWYDPALKGVTLKDNSMAYQVCFEAIAPGQTSVEFGDKPTVREITNAGGKFFRMASRKATVTVK